MLSYFIKVHTLNDESRGATMEAVISRMKTVHTELTRTGLRTGGVMKAIRFVAVSATVPNVQDVCVKYKNLAHYSHSKAIHFQKFSLWLCVCVCVCVHVYSVQHK